MDDLYRQQFSDADVRLLRSAAGPTAAVDDALASPAMEAALFAHDHDDPSHGAGGGMPGAGDRMPMGVTPFLVFAVAVHRTAARLDTATFVDERWTGRTRIPVFDVGTLRTLVADPGRRYFLVELLASYTKVASGVTWTRTSRGWRRRRFSELDPGRMAELLDVVGPAERPGVLRRLGDLALFQLGVFPDHPPELTGPATDRLLRVSGLDRRQSGAVDGRQLLEALGARWYAAAVASARAAGTPVTGTLAVAGYMADHFDDARRVLNVVTDRYLFPLRDHWFGGG